MSYTPVNVFLNPLGFFSPEKERNTYRIWTNQANTRQIRAHRNSTSTWLDFYQRLGAASPWHKLVTDPSPATQADFYQQLTALGWLV